MEEVETGGGGCRSLRLEMEDVGGRDWRWRMEEGGR